MSFDLISNFKKIQLKRKKFIDFHRYVLYNLEVKLLNGRMWYNFYKIQSLYPVQN